MRRQSSAAFLTNNSESLQTAASDRSTSIPVVQTPRMRLLVVEDEHKVANALREGLEGEGYEVIVEHTGEGAFFRMTTEAFDLILLDLMLPGRDGLQILTTLRDRGVKTPVLVLTARDTLQDRVIGLNSGADDYLVKPFAFAEVLARIRALLRRGRVTEARRLSVGDLDMDLVARRVTRGGRVVELTAREFELLEYLLRHEGQVVSRETLGRDVWRETARSTTLDNVIDVHIARLRRKVDLERPIKLIHTIRGVGFTLREGEP
jgi:DNA-binding response OmpR family regulator